MTDTATTVLNPRELLGVYRDERNDQVPRYWRTLGGFDRNTFQSTRPDIIFEKITTGRPIAPFILPTNVGRPIYKRRGSEAKSFTPAYIKPKDPVVPSEQFTRRPGDLFTDVPRTPQQNWDAEVAAILREHRLTIDRTWEYMCARALIDGALTVDYLDGPSVTIDYDRDPNLEVIKTTNFWDADYDIYSDLQTWIDLMARAQFGGNASRLTVGRDVWPVMRTNESILEQMDTTMRNGDADLLRGLVPPTTPENPFVFLGRIGTLEVVLYNDYYEDDSGLQVDFMSASDIVLSTGNVGGVMAFGAILDNKARLEPMPVFSKMWDNEDPAAQYIMSQSAPLPINVFPNRVFHARVVPEDSNS